ncbi:unnamed protein product [Nyctereutes procyonoides]|uniref:(raccoon dog) hypothetical protein n=1 Tax=Nyctereutes procyonoides TaxID=34880 RepID=A0A811YTN6_NYCPR|nr:unnamed protein product [Nyctereutes procyonoides]
MAALMMSLVMLSSPLIQSRDTPELYCLPEAEHLLRAQRAPRDAPLPRAIHLHAELFAQLDSAAGVFAAVSELGRVTARNWNVQREFLALRQSAVDTVCKHIFDLDQGFTLQRRVQPKVNVSPSKKGRLQHHNLLVCHEETAGVLSTNLIHNGDWTFQILVMLGMTPQQGDIYTCQVEHPSLDGPVTVEWSEGTSDSARSKMLAGVRDFVLGLIALLVSFILRFRSQRVSQSSGIKPWLLSYSIL